MRQVKPQSRPRRKRCANCRDLFDPDPRAKDRQKYCSKSSCQDHRQRLNEKNWREKNPDCLAYQQGQSQSWHKARHDYSRKRRASDPALTIRNRIQTRFRMRDRRFRSVFDKSKSSVKTVASQAYWSKVKTNIQPIAQRPTVRPFGPV